MKRNLLLILLLILFLVFSGCGSPKSNSLHNLPQAPAKGVYMAMQKSGTYQGCIWINGQQYDMGDVRIRDVVVANDTIYALGYYLYHDPVNHADYGRGCYWIGDQRFELPSAEHSQVIVRSITVDGSDVYVCGQYDSKPCYWKNGVRHDLPYLESEEQGGGYVNDICVKNGNVYCAGSTGYSHGIGCYWINDTRYDLTTEGNPFTSAGAKAIYVDGTDVYVVGEGAPSGSYPAACYWVNGVKHVLNVPDLTATQCSRATDVFVYNGDVYIAGYCDANGMAPDYDTITLLYWKNEVRTDLYSFDYSVYEDSGFEGVFIAADTENVYVACDLLPYYWINGVMTEIENIHGYQISSIYKY